MTWREGVHLTSTPIWCDARRRRDVCFVSSADRVGAGGHGQLIATPETLALIARRGAASQGHLAVPLHRPFTLGTLRLELVASGRGPGAAALHVGLEGRSVLYAGEVRAGAEARACDAVVVGAPLGEAHHVLPTIDRALAELVAWLKPQLARRPVLVVDTVLDALELAQRLAAEGIAVTGTRRVRDAAAKLDVELSTSAREPAAVLRIEGEKSAADVVALVSPRALDPHDYATAFTWPSVADRKHLLAWIEATRARDVFVTGAYAEAITTALGPRARMLGPPRQMLLFEAAR